MDRNLALDFVRATEAAALACGRWVGRGDNKAADKAAVEAMRKVFSSIPIKGTVVIGEGERDEAPMLFIGEEVGNGEGEEFDIAVDPLEGTNITARGDFNSICVLAAAPKGCLLHAPDTYMDKIAVGPKAKGVIDLDKSPEENIKAVAKKLDKELDDMTLIIMDRQRNQKYIDAARKLGATIQLIRDGDVAGGIAPAIEESGVDMLMGIGAAPEGVLAASALKCLGGDIQGRLLPKSAVKTGDPTWPEDELKRATEMGISDVTKKLLMEDLVKGDRVLFAATGVTDGTILKGVRFKSHGAWTQSIVMRSKSGTVRMIEADHNFEHDPKSGKHLKK